jgi:hypothetical protein
MLRYLVLAVAGIAACARADDATTTSSGSAPTKTTEGEGPATHTVKVGWVRLEPSRMNSGDANGLQQPGFQFTPNTTQAKVGDVIGTAQPPHLFASCQLAAHLHENSHSIQVLPARPLGHSSELPPRMHSL